MDVIYLNFGKTFHVSQYPDEEIGFSWLREVYALLD